MNDRYLFRAKTCDGEWATGFLMQLYGKLCIMHPIDEDTICQCTGLLENTGTMIFENDIIEAYNAGIGRTIRGVVKFGIYYEHFGFYIEWLEPHYPRDLMRWLPRIKCIGNIFDNPELLEV